MSGYEYHLLAHCHFTVAFSSFRPHPPKSKQFTVVFVPQKSVFCVNRLEVSSSHSHTPYGYCPSSQSEKLSEISPIVNFRIKEFHLDMLPLENDVISLNIETAFTVSNDNSV